MLSQEKEQQIMKKLLTLLFACFVVAAMSMPVFAQDENASPTAQTETAKPKKEKKAKKAKTTKAKKSKKEKKPASDTGDTSK
jgi:nitrate reductase cytochrome c-type subunit